MVAFNSKRRLQINEKVKKTTTTYWYPTGNSLRLQSESSVSIPKQSMVMDPAMMAFKSAFKRDWDKSQGNGRLSSNIY